MIGRLEPGATIAQAQAQIDAQNSALETDDPQARLMADAGFRSMVVSLRRDHVAAIRPTLWLLEAGVLLLLLIGTVNLANLLLVRAGARVREVAVRQALGASRADVVNETVIETTLLTLGGGVLGLIVAGGGIRLLAWFGAGHLPLGSQITIDGRVALAGIAAALGLGFALAIPIAWFQLRHQLNNSLKSETRGGTAGRAAQKLRHIFLVAQIALSFVLLASAGLLGMSLKKATAVSPGFQPEHVLTARILLTGNKYSSPETDLIFTERLLNELTHQPGIVSAGVVNNIPFSGRNGKSAANVVGHVVRSGESLRGHFSYGVGGDYFRAMGFSLREGRFLTAADSRRRQRVCLVDEDFARYYWPHSSALGHRLFQGSETGPDADAFTVVGVVGGVKQAGLTDDSAQGAVYYPYIYRADANIFVVVRSNGAPESLGSTLQSVVRQVDPELSANDMRPMDGLITESLAGRRSPALLGALFSGMALLLSAVGIYGVLSYAVTLRRREIGVRIALGARPGQIRGQFFKMALRLLTGGTILGLFGAWLTGQAMRTVLFHVSPVDTPILAGAAVVVFGVSLGACLLPARRAARISPMEALADS